MRRRTVIVNSVLAVALVGVVAGSAVAIAGGGRQPEPTGTMVAVKRGTVTATVTATGNVEAGSTVSVASPGSGKVTRIYVTKGQRVDKGDRLFRIDDTTEQQDLDTANATLASAQAGLETTTQGRSAQDRAVDDASVRSAQTSLDNARTAARHAKATYQLDKKQQDKLVAKAEDAVDDAEQQLTDDRDALTDAEAALATAQQTGDTAAVTEAQNTITQLQAAIGTDETAVANARTSLTQARQTRDKTLLADKQAIQTQGGQVAAAEDQLTSAKAQRASNQQPARQGALDSAQAQIDSAQAAVDKAERAVENTTVRAPADGTVAEIGAVLGQSTPDSAGSGSGTSTGTGAGGTGGAASSSGSSAGASGAMVTLVDDGAKQVTAAVAEADIVKVRSGQAATVTFPASGTTLTGRVTSVATRSTVSNNVVQYDVAVALPTAGPAVKLGQTGDVTITTAQHTDVLFVPTSAITTADGHSTVTRRTGGTDATVEVETGLVGATGTEIVRGLAEGDQLVLPTGETGGAFTFPGAGSSPSSTPSSSR